MTVDLRTVDVLTRAHLAGRRMGYELRLCRAPPELVDLIAFVGLADVLGVEARRETEQREEALRVEEEGELGDLSA